MNEDDDVERLFSWLQTPELRYREFAGAREITDTIPTWQARASAPPPPDPRNTQLAEEYPPDQFPDQSGLVGAPIGRPMPLPAPPSSPVPAPRAATVAAPAASPVPGEPFALGASGRGIPRRPEYAEPVAPERIVEPSAPPAAPRVVEPAAQAPPVRPPAPAPAASTSAAPTAHPTSAATEGRLLGGAFRENGPSEPAPTVAADQSAPAAHAGQQRDDRSLDAVFGRLAGGRNRLPDPRDRLRHLPGQGPPPGRPR